MNPFPDLETDVPQRIRAQIDAIEMETGKRPTELSIPDTWFQELSPVGAEANSAGISLFGVRIKPKPCPHAAYEVIDTDEATADGNPFESCISCGETRGAGSR